MVWIYPMVTNFLKICLFVSTEHTNVTDKRTDGRTDVRTDTAHDGIGALMHSITRQKLLDPKC